MKKHLLTILAAMAFAAPALECAAIDGAVSQTYIRAATWANLASATNALAHAIADAAPADYANVSNRAYSAVQPGSLAAAKWPWSSITNAPATWAWSAITGKPTSWAWSAITGKPTTLAGYGIADAYTKTQSDAQYLPRDINDVYTVGGLITEYLIDGNRQGGVRVGWSRYDNHAKSTLYGYDGITARREGADESYLYDSTANGIARLKDIPSVSGLASQSWVDEEITIRLTSTNAFISVSNGVQRIYEVDGDTRTLKWQWDMGFAAVTNQVNSLAAQMPRKIENASSWADWGARGIANPFPGAVALDRGSTYFGSTNVVWTASNGFAVMTAHMPAAAGGNASQFRIGTDADDWFGLEVTASYLIDAHADSFAVASASGGTKTATITTDYDASYPSSPPVVYYTATLAEPFAQLDTGVSWAHNASSHVSTCTIQGLTAPSGFFFLKKWAAGGAIMRSTLPFLPEGYRVEKNGSYVGTVQPDSIITITVGSKQYQLIAQEVQ